MTEVCSDCAVRDSALCAALNDEQLLQLNRLGRRQRVVRGETVQWTGDESLVFANIIDGVLKLSTSTADGREQIVGLLYPADFLGRLFAVRVDYDATALTDAELCVFPRKAFEAALAARADARRARQHAPVDASARPQERRGKGRKLSRSYHEAPQAGWLRWRSGPADL